MRWRRVGVCAHVVHGRSREGGGVVLVVLGVAEMGGGGEEGW